MRKFLTIALLALTASLSFSQENGLKLGVRHGFNLHNVFWNGKPPVVGIGFGGGIAGVIPITGSLAFNPEVNFYYRNVYNHKLSKDTSTTIPAGPLAGTKVEGWMTIKESMAEYAVGIPLLLQFKPISDFYVIGGVLFTFPIKSELECELSLDPVNNMIPNNSKTMDFKNRSKVDVGVVLGGGYYINKHAAVDIRGSLDLTNLSSKENDRNPPYNPFRHDKTWLIQYGIGVSFFL